MFPPFDPDRDDRKRRPLAFARGQVPIRVRLDDAATDREPESGARGLRREVRLETSLAGLVRHSSAGVSHRELQTNPLALG